MIFRANASFLEKTFAIHGSIIRAISPLIFLAAILGFVAAYIGDTNDDDDMIFGFTPFTALGVAVSLFLGFRNNACYARWWEGRTQWGKQVIVTRNIPRVCATFMPEASAKLISNLAVAHSHALRGQLRKTFNQYNNSKDHQYQSEAFLEAAKYISNEHRAAVMESANPSDGILRLAGSLLRGALIDPNCQECDTIAASIITAELNKLCEVQGACERLATALVPFPYSLLVHRTVVLYVTLAPFAMASTMGYYTILFNAIVAYTFFGLDEVARCMEQPFGDEPLCLSMEALCRTIETSVAEAFGDSVKPPLIPDAKFTLM